MESLPLTQLAAVTLVVLFTLGQFADHNFQNAGKEGAIIVNTMIVLKAPFV